MRLDRLRLRRLVVGLRQNELAEKVGLSQATISRIEGGRRVTEDQAVKIAKALGVDNPYILFDEVR